MVLRCFGFSRSHRGGACEKYEYRRVFVVLPVSCFFFPQRMSPFGTFMLRLLSLHLIVNPFHYTTVTP